jgi:hypothetical protein
MSCYALATGKGRQFPAHGYTSKSILQTRLRENTTGAALSLTVVIPFLQRVNKSVEQHIDAGVEITSKDILNIAQDAGKQTLFSFVEASSRTGCQALIASVMIDKQDAYLNSVVYSWDMYPRLHQKYVGDFLSKLHLPRFIATLLGPKTQSADLDFFRAPTAGAAVIFEDCVKRNAIAAAADMIVDTAKALLFQSNKVTVVINRAVLHSTVLVARGAGAVAGHAAKSDVGEYWGERIGSVVGALVAVQLIVKINGGNKEKKGK